MAIPAVRSLYEQGFDIHWVCGRAVQPLLECYSWITLIPVDDRAILDGGPLERAKHIATCGRRSHSADVTLCNPILRSSLSLVGATDSSTEKAGSLPSVEGHLSACRTSPLQTNIFASFLGAWTVINSRALCRCDQIVYQILCDAAAKRHAASRSFLVERAMSLASNCCCGGLWRDM
jgi:hypothetical protein